ncbi:NAD(P)-dependent oxidoreductase [Bradyrhizobium erythrophlei]|nr:NAD(P)-dependent oxidoreductase [Bradyrhizobium erythrophlei]
MSRTAPPARPGETGAVRSGHFTASISAVGSGETDSLLSTEQPLNSNLRSLAPIAGDRPRLYRALPAQPKFDFRRHLSEAILSVAQRRGHQGEQVMPNHIDEVSTKRDTLTDPSQHRKIGVIGLGLMGTAIAANLVADGCDVVAYVRRPERVKDLRSLGIHATTHLPGLFSSDVLISMLPDDDAVRDVFFGSSGIADCLPSGAIHLSMSTISTGASTEFAREHERRGQGYVAAPVFGNPDAAKARQLAIVVAGAPEHCERCRPVTDTLGQTFLVGTDPTQANLIKLLGNMMTATSLEVLGEIITVLRKRGQDPQQFVDIMTATMFGSRVHKSYGSRLIAGSFAPGLTMPLALKDVRLALTEAELAGAPMPSVGVVRDRLITGIARGHGGLDWTALGLVASEEAGIDAGDRRQPA